MAPSDVAAARAGALALAPALATAATEVLDRLAGYAEIVLAAQGSEVPPTETALRPPSPMRAAPVPPLPPAPSAREALARLAARADLNIATDAFPERAARAPQPGPLSGLPFVAKDLFDVAGRPTRAGGRSLPDTPAPTDADAVAALEAAGAVLVARTGMDEHAYGFSGENAHDGDVLNPHDPAHLSGGSSSGSAAAVAAGVAPLALGSDTNGSVRVPAALCGAWGLKPTFKRLSRRGMAPFVDSLDHVGLLADHPDRLAAGYAALAGEAPAAPDGQPRVALLGGYFARFDDPEVAAAMTAARAALGPAAELDLPLATAARAAAFLVTAAEGGALHAPMLVARPEAFGPLVRPRLAAGAVLPARWLLAAQDVREAWTRQLLSALEGADLLLAPAVPFVAPRRDERMATVSGEAHDARLALGLFTQPLTLAGVPVLVAPHRRPGRLPTGVQLVAAPGREDLCLWGARRLAGAGFAAALAPEPAHA